MTTAGDGDAPLPPPRCFGRVGDDVDNVASLSGRGRFLGDKKGLSEIASCAACASMAS